MPRAIEQDIRKRVKTWGFAFIEVGGRVPSVSWVYSLLTNVKM